MRRDRKSATGADDRAADLSAVPERAHLHRRQRRRAGEIPPARAARLDRGRVAGAWATATGGRGQLAIRTDADIDVELDGSGGTSALTQHKVGGKIVSRTIAVHSVEGSRRLSVSELLVTTLHELGHIWCCFGPGTTDGHWTDTPTVFSSVGLMYSPMTCTVAAGSDPVCPTIFSDRELAEMHLTAP